MERERREGAETLEIPKSDIVVEFPELDLQSSGHEELLQVAAATMKSDPVKGACLTGMVIGRGKGVQKKVEIALAAYLQYCQHINPQAVGHIRLAPFVKNPPPKLHAVVRGIIEGMEEKGYV